jgi:hypothetical protein
MPMAPAVRRFVLTVHVIVSVGWFGAVAAFLALAVAGLASRSVQTVQAASLAMELIGLFVITPLSLASLASGLVSALGSPWGLFRHYWVVFKLVLNVVATAVLLLYIQSLGYFAGLVRNEGLTSADLAQLRDPTHVLHATAALIVLGLAAVLAVYKPRGMTRYGQRKQLVLAARNRSA